MALIKKVLRFLSRSYSSQFNGWVKIVLSLIVYKYVYISGNSTSFKFVIEIIL